MSPIDIVGLIRGRKQQRAAGIEELAKRLATGEAVPPEEIETLLEATGCDEEMLQARIDALVRRAELRQKVAEGEKSQKQIEAISADIAAAWQRVVDADLAHRQLRTQHDEALILLGQAVRTGDGAADELLSPELLAPIDRDRLAELRRAASAAAEALAEAKRRLPDLRVSLERAEQASVVAGREAKAFRSNPDVQRRKGEAEQSVKARGARLKEAEADLPKLEQAAEQAEAAVVKLEAELRAS